MARLKRKVKKTLKWSIVLIVVIGIAIGGFAIYSKSFEIKNVIDLFNIEDKEKVEEKDKWPKEYTIDLIATGDGLLHNLLVDYGKTSDGGYDFSEYLTEIEDIIPEYDIAYYNQETVFGGKEIGYSTYPTFNTPSEFGDAMLDIGFNMVSIASNHSFDRGETAARNAIEYWENTGVMFNGMASSEEDRVDYMIMEKNNISYALLSYTYGTNGIPLPSGKDYLVSVYDEEMLRADVAALRDQVDVLIVAMHWGTEYTFTPTSTQKSQAQLLAELDVDIVIGTHSHCLQPVEWIDDTLIIYSLGNFISNQIELMDTIGYKGVIGALLSLDIHKTEYEDGTSEINVDNVNVDLTYTYRNKAERYYKVVPFSKMTTDYLANYKDIYEQYKAVIQDYDETINVVPAA